MLIFLSSNISLNYQELEEINYYNWNRLGHEEFFKRGGKKIGRGTKKIGYKSKTKTRTISQKEQVDLII